MEEIACSTVRSLKAWGTRQVDEAQSTLDLLFRSAQRHPGKTCLYLADFMLTPLALDSLWFLAWQCLEEVSKEEPSTLSITYTGAQLSYSLFRLSLESLTGQEMGELIREHCPY